MKSHPDSTASSLEKAQSTFKTSKSGNYISLDTKAVI